MVFSSEVESEDVWGPEGGVQPMSAGNNGCKEMKKKKKWEGKEKKEQGRAKGGIVR